MTTSRTLTYHAGAELGPAELTLTANKELVDLADGYDFTVTIVDAAGRIVHTKNDGMVGDAVAPNLRIEWATDDLDLRPGTYGLQIQARNASNLDWRWAVRLRVLPWGTPPDA